jgi:hypothetical protein
MQLFTDLVQMNGERSACDVQRRFGDVVIFLSRRVQVVCYV